MPLWVTWRRARTTSSSSTNCRSGSKPKMDGQTGRDRFRLIGVVRCVAEDVGEAQHGHPGAGLSSEKSRTSPSASTSARSTLFLTGLVRGVSSRNVFGSLAAEP